MVAIGPIFSGDTTVNGKVDSGETWNFSFADPLEVSGGKLGSCKVSSVKIEAVADQRLKATVVTSAGNKVYFFAETDLDKFLSNQSIPVNSLLSLDPSLSDFTLGFKIKDDSAPEVQGSSAIASGAASLSREPVSSPAPDASGPSKPLDGSVSAADPRKLPPASFILPGVNGLDGLPLHYRPSPSGGSVPDVTDAEGGAAAAAPPDSRGGSDDVSPSSLADDTALAQEIDQVTGMVEATQPTFDAKLAKLQQQIDDFSLAIGEASGKDKADLERLQASVQLKWDAMTAYKNAMAAWDGNPETFNAPITVDGKTLPICVVLADAILKFGGRSPLNGDAKPGAKTPFNAPNYQDFLSFMALMGGPPPTISAEAFSKFKLFSPSLNYYDGSGGAPALVSGLAYAMRNMQDVQQTDARFVNMDLAELAKIFLKGTHYAPANQSFIVDQLPAELEAAFVAKNAGEKLEGPEPLIAKMPLASDGNWVSTINDFAKNQLGFEHPIGDYHVSAFFGAKFLADLAACAKDDIAAQRALVYQYLLRALASRHNEFQLRHPDQAVGGYGKLKSEWVNAPADKRPAAQLALDEYVTSHMLAFMSELRMHDGAKDKAAVEDAGKPVAAGSHANEKAKQADANPKEMSEEDLAALQTFYTTWTSGEDPKTAAAYLEAHGSDFLASIKKEYRDDAVSVVAAYLHQALEAIVSGKGTDKLPDYAALFTAFEKVLDSPECTSADKAELKAKCHNYATVIAKVMGAPPMSKEEALKALSQTNIALLMADTNEGPKPVVNTDGASITFSPSIPDSDLLISLTAKKPQVAQGVQVMMGAKLSTYGADWIISLPEKGDGHFTVVFTDPTGISDKTKNAEIRIALADGRSMYYNVAEDKVSDKPMAHEGNTNAWPTLTAAIDPASPPPAAAAPAEPKVDHAKTGSTTSASAKPSVPPAPKGGSVPAPAAPKVNSSTASSSTANVSLAVADDGTIDLSKTDLAGASRVKVTFGAKTWDVRVSSAKAKLPSGWESTIGEGKVRVSKLA